MIVIDHRYYPHIIDLIWSEMEFDERWAVRSVSKAWLIRADLELSTHVVIERMDATAFNAKVICLAHPGHTINITQAAMGCLMPDAKYPHPDDIARCVNASTARTLLSMLSDTLQTLCKRKSHVSGSLILANSDGVATYSVISTRPNLRDCRILTSPMCSTSISTLLLSPKSHWTRGTETEP